MPLPTPHLPKTENDRLRARAEALHLHGLLTHWSEVVTQPWLAPMLDWEEQQRARRSLERRLSAAHIGRFKPLCDFEVGTELHEQSHLLTCDVSSGQFGSRRGC